MKPIVFALVAFVSLVVGVMVLSGPGNGQIGSPSATAVPHYRDAAMVKVAITDDAVISRGQEPVLVQLIEGIIPESVQELLVLTDEQCAADADGVSHCLNQVSFRTPDGDGEATLQHHHRMSEEPCLSPGETVALVA